MPSHSCTSEWPLRSWRPCLQCCEIPLLLIAKWLWMALCSKDGTQRAWPDGLGCGDCLCTVLLPLFCLVENYRFYYGFKRVRGHGFMGQPHLAPSPQMSLGPPSYACCPKYVWFHRMSQIHHCTLVISCGCDGAVAGGAGWASRIAGLFAQSPVWLLCQQLAASTMATLWIIL